MATCQDAAQALYSALKGSDEENRDSSFHGWAEVCGSMFSKMESRLLLAQEPPELLAHDNAVPSRRGELRH